MSYTQLAQEQRYQIYALMKHGRTQSQIARFLSVHRSTVSRELRRNRGQRGYRPQQAQRLAQERRYRGLARIEPAVWRLVEEQDARIGAPSRSPSGWTSRACS